MKDELAPRNRGYSLVVWVVMVVYAAPLLLAWQWWAPLDYSPYFMCFGVGVAVSLAVWRLGSPALSKSWPARLRIVAICWPPCLAIGVGLGANMLLDSSPRVGHDARFLGYHNAHKGPSHVRYSSWRQPNAEERLTCTAGRQEHLCLNLALDTPVVVTTRDGALGWQWVEKVAAR